MRALAPPISNQHGVQAPAQSPPGGEADSSEEPLRAVERSPLEDVGVFGEFDDTIRPQLPAWIGQEDITILRHVRRGEDGETQPTFFAMTAGVIVAQIERSEGEEAWRKRRVIDVARWGETLDTDQDGIPDQLDILRGALKVTENGARYEGGYERLDYPGGDVSSDKGVCTDVVIRAVRNAGIDLQVELFEDIGASPRSFPMVKKRDPHIDQRRVKTLLPYFKRQWRSLAVEVGGEGEEAYLPGDIVFMQTMGDERPDHVGIVSDEVGESGHPLIVNNWTDGYSTSKMDLLGFVPVTHRFRRKAALPEPAEASQRGLRGVLGRQGISPGEEVKQVVLVTASSWRSTTGELRLYERDPEQPDRWRRARRGGEVIEVNLGRGGLGKGRGLAIGSKVGEGVSRVKKEGDGRSPAGVFSLGMAFGKGKEAPREVDRAWSWHAVEPGDLWVDDPESAHYNTLVEHDSKKAAFSSAEDLTIYDLAVVIEHNTKPMAHGAGSAIFLHTLAPGKGATAGCTSMAKKDLLGVLGWLNVEKHPVLIQVVDEVL